MDRNNLHVAVVGATGAVGVEMVKTLERRNFPLAKLTLLASARSVGKTLTYKGQDLAVLTIEDKWEPDKVVEAKGCYGTTSLEHPAVRMIATERRRFYLGGLVQGLELPKRVFPCKTPAEVRAGLPEGEDVVAFQCRNPIHRAHYELFTRALHASNVSENAVVLVHPTCGPTQQDDIPGTVRFQTYERL
ncbi:MAG: sulfate adenylyltransferase, partial [Verrucomicrobiota bacterium]